MHYITTIDYAEDGTPVVGYHEAYGPFEKALVDAGRLVARHSVVSLYRRYTDAEPDLLWSTRDEKRPRS